MEQLGSCLSFTLQSRKNGNFKGIFWTRMQYKSPKIKKNISSFYQFKHILHPFVKLIYVINN